MSEVVWTPRSDDIEKSNVSRFMRRHGLREFAALQRKSVEDPEWFWGAVEKDLGIEWFRPYRTVVDSSAGVPWAKWFVGGKVNVTHNCLDRHALSRRRDQLALLWEGEDGSIRRYTFAQASAETSRVANALRKIGIRKGDTVGLYLPICPEAIFASFACAKIGAIYIPIFSGFGPEAVASRLQDAGAEVLLTMDGYLRRGKWIEMKPVADEAVKQAPDVHTVVTVRRRGGSVPWQNDRDRWWNEWVAGESSECPAERTDSEDPFLLIYTSGTTGKPKGAVHVHGGFLVKIAQEVAYQTDVRDGDVLCWVTDMGWIMAPWELVGGWALGAPIVTFEGAPDYPTPDRIWGILSRHGVTVLGISPTLIRVLMKYGLEPVRKHDLGKLRILGSTGEPWNPESWRWFFEQVGGGRCPIINLSGGTEVGACFLSPHPVEPLKPCTLAGPSLGMDVDVWDEKGKPVRGAVGELVAKKPWPGMTRGLWKDPERYLETYWSRWQDTWVHGDWASIDGDGFWFLHGRSDDTIKVAGKRVGPAEVESALTSHPAVLEAAAIGVPDEVKGESIVCFVVLRPGFHCADTVQGELQEQVVRSLGKTMKPQRVHFVTQLPKTRNAKILRRLIRAKYLGKQDVGDLSNLENPQALEEIRPAG